MTKDKNSQLSPDIKFQLVRKMERHKVVGLAEHYMLPHELKYLEFHRIAGIILFGRNLESLPQLSELIGEVDELLVENDRVPLIMADHEGDFVSELRELIGIPPAAMAIAATKDPSLARDVAYETGSAMRKLGVNVVLAPVADCYFERESPVTGLRSFGKDPERVADFVSQSIQGFNDAGMLTCVKHFPGHGATVGDSHESLPEIIKTMDELRQTDLVPFGRAVDDGVDMVMTAHVAFRLGEKTDDDVPASFDSRLIRGVLRDELGFDGVIITDALEMEGARGHARERYGGLASGFGRAILAGSDLLLYASPIPERIRLQEDSEPVIAVEVMQTIIDTLHRVVDRNRIDKKLEEAAEANEGIRNLLSILDASEKRVTRLRAKATEHRLPPTPKPDSNVIHLEDYASVPVIYKTVAEQSITVLRDPDGFLPAGISDEWVLLPIIYGESAMLKRQDLPSFLDGLCRTFEGWRASSVVTSFGTADDGAVQPVFSTRGNGDDSSWSAPSAGTVHPSKDSALLPVFSTRGMPPTEFLEQLTEFVEQRQVPMVIVTGAPILDWIPETTGCILTFGASPQVAAATAAVLSGEAAPKGSIDGLF